MHMITSILTGINSTLIAINDPPTVHPASVVFSKTPLTPDALFDENKGFFVPGIITGLDRHDTKPYDMTGTDWVNLRDNSSTVKYRHGPRTGQYEGMPTAEYTFKTTALVADPADIRSAIAQRMVTTIPVWEVEYSSPKQEDIMDQEQNFPPTRLERGNRRLPRNHSFQYEATLNKYPFTVTLKMTTTKVKAATTVTYYPISKL